MSALSLFVIKKSNPQDREIPVVWAGWATGYSAAMADAAKRVGESFEVFCENHYIEWVKDKEEEEE